MLKLAVIGDGKMGSLIRDKAGDYGFEPVLVLGLANNKEGRGINSENFEEIDAAIDFTHPSVVKTHIEKLAALRVPLVVGTTGWYDDSGWVEKLAETHQTKIVYGSNFSLGVQLFIKLVQRAAELYGNAPGFDAALHEVHHMGKVDAPSGTALTLAQKWLNATGTDKKMVFGVPEKGAVSPDEFRITAQRIGSVFGDHSLRIQSDWDDIEVSHSARSREGFISGALKTAGWLHALSGHGFFRVEDVVEEVLRG
jgi:4-hydroxy-tetrahydrodipicolinate reductase